MTIECNLNITGITRSKRVGGGLRHFRQPHERVLGGGGGRKRPDHHHGVGVVAIEGALHRFPLGLCGLRSRPISLSDQTSWVMSFA